MQRPPSAARVCLATAACLLLPVGAAPAANDETSELIVRFVEPPTQELLDALAAELPDVLGWRALRHVPHPKNDPDGIHPLAFVRVATLTGPASSVATAAALTARPNVVRAEPNAQVRLASDPPPDTRDTSGPNDPLFSRQWALHRIDALEAWKEGRGTGRVVVAVIDSGLLFEHEDLEGAIWTNLGEIPDNGIDDDGNSLIDDWRGWNFISNTNCQEDRANHGTPVSGVIGARTNNERGIAGLANVKLMAVTAGGAATSVIEATYYATDMGSHVINFSLGSYNFLKELELAVEYAWNNGNLVVGGAGNDGWGARFYPAAFDRVMAVSASTRDDSIWEDSNFGSWIDVAAPGGVGVLSCDADDAAGYIELGGTSIAAPHVSGLAALVRSLAPELSPRKTRAFIQASADDLGDPGFDERFGHGRINAANTLRLAARLQACPADLDGEGTVGIGDLIVLLPNWGSNHWLADVNDDGVVDIADLIEVLAAWGACE